MVANRLPRIEINIEDINTLSNAIVALIRLPLTTGILDVVTIKEILDMSFFKLLDSLNYQENIDYQKLYNLYETETIPHFEAFCIKHLSNLREIEENDS